MISNPCHKHLADATQAVRSGGFYVVTISDLKQGLLVLYGKFDAISGLYIDHSG